MSDVVTYEDFGAKGDGVHDDLPAICQAHDHANAKGLPVKTAPKATYHLGRQALTAVIMTDTDWNTSRFTVDDTDVDDRTKALFVVSSALEPVDLQIASLTRDQSHMDVTIDQPCYVMVEQANKLLYRRMGLNQNDGKPQHDCFVVYPDGRIDGAIDWEYDDITRVVANPIDAHRLTLSGGVFTTFANRMNEPDGYHYWTRNIKVTRSNTEVVGLVHYVTGETDVGQPYNGFLAVDDCADVTLRDCFMTPHKIYSTIGAAGKPVNMGSYDLHGNNVVNFSLINCRQNLVTDRTRWGIIGTNFCKNLVLEDCHLSRMDTHMGVAGGYTLRRCTFGHMGINAIGRGELLVEDCTLYGPSLVNFRGDYGSTWEGNVIVRNCEWTPSCGDAVQPKLFNTTNHGMHDFGYPCFMPETVTVDNVVIHDSNHPHAYEGPMVFSDPDGSEGQGSVKDRPFIYTMNKKVILSNVTTDSGKPIRISDHEELSSLVEFEVT